MEQKFGVKEDGIVLVESSEGVFIDGERWEALESEDAFIKHFSENYIASNWKEVEVGADEGDMTPNSLFFSYENWAPLPCASGFFKFSYCSDPKFAAGFLKYVALSDVACDMLFTEEQYKANCQEEMDGEVVYVRRDVEAVLEILRATSQNPYEAVDKVKHIIRLCDNVFHQQDEALQKECLIYAVQKFNEYFENADNGYTYMFKVYCGADAVKDEMISGIVDPDMKHYLEETFAKSQWDDLDRKLLNKVMELQV